MKSARLVLSMIADDHATPASDYRYIVQSFDTPIPLPHGLPAVAPFTNWIEVAVPVDVTPAETLTVTLTNASRASPHDWIAVQWIELRLTLSDP